MGTEPEEKTPEPLSPIASAASKADPTSVDAPPKKNDACCVVA